MKPRHIAVVAGNFAFPWTVNLLAEISKRIKPGQRVAHYSTLARDEVAARHYDAIAYAKEPTAVICLSVRPPTDSMKLLQDRGVPVVCIDERATGASTVSVDNYEGGRIAAEHLIAAGHQHMAVVCGKVDCNGGYNAGERLRGFKNELAVNGLTLDNRNVIEVTFYHHQDGRNSMTALLDSGRPIDAIFCAAGDDCASGMLAVAVERKVRVPGAIAVVGFDDTRASASTTPPLTTIRQSLPDLAKIAYDLASGDIIGPKDIRLKPALVVRESSPASAASKRGAA
jgi:DNA-binding LacI/PurR family transcriptional regulator